MTWDSTGNCFARGNVTFVVVDWESEKFLDRSVVVVQSVAFSIEYFFEFCSEWDEFLGDHRDKLSSILPLADVVVDFVEKGLAADFEVFQVAFVFVSRTVTSVRGVAVISFPWTFVLVVVKWWFNVWLTATAAATVWFFSCVTWLFSGVVWFFGCVGWLFSGVDWFLSGVGWLFSCVDWLFSRVLNWFLRRFVRFLRWFVRFLRRFVRFLRRFVRFLSRFVWCLCWFFVWFFVWFFNWFVWFFIVSAVRSVVGISVLNDARNSREKFPFEFKIETKLESAA